MTQIDETTIQITDYKVLGKLPDPFLKPDGTRVTDPAEWAQQRKHLYKTAVELQYGTMPPAPEFVEVETLHNSDGKYTDSSYRITTGTKACPVTFGMRIFRPALADKHIPVVINGDLCFNYAFRQDFVNTFLNENIAVVLFNRTELAHDIKNEGRGKGALYRTYPDYTFGAVGAWAWGYSRVIDALEQLDLFDLHCVALTGHSRGGKTVALAGALDERATIVNPNEACAGGCGCYRIHIHATPEDGKPFRSETLADIWKNYPFWFGPAVGDYVHREAELPFDSHFLKALIAPRVLFVSEATADIWANPVGSWMTTTAAGEVYDFLGCPENLYWYYRLGHHAHAVQDLQMLVNVIKHQTEGRALSNDFFKLPFPKPDPIYDWCAPNK